MVAAARRETELTADDVPRPDDSNNGDNVQEVFRSLVEQAVSKSDLDRPKTADAGAQGGGAADVAAGLKNDGLGALVNSSRGIIFAYLNEKFRGAGDGAWQASVEAATHDMIAQLRAETPAGKLA